MKNKRKTFTKYGLFLVLSFSIQFAFSQKKITDQHQTWTQYFLTVRLHEKWSVNSDILYRSNELF